MKKTSTSSRSGRHRDPWAWAPLDTLSASSLLFLTVLVWRSSMMLSLAIRLV